MTIIPYEAIMDKMPNEHTSNIRIRILIPLSLTFLVLLCGFLYTAFAISNDGITHELEREHGETIAILKEMLASRTRLMTAAAEVILNDPATETGNASQRSHRTLFRSPSIFTKTF
jgi:two-component system, NtrC family, sensor kinase